MIYKAITSEMTSKHFNTSLLVSNLPLLSVVLIEAQLRYFLMQTDGNASYFSVVMQVLFESAPFFIAHYLAVKMVTKTTANMADKMPKRQAVLFWVAGFAGYPLLSFTLNNQFPSYNDWSLLSLQGVALSAVASLAWFINRAVLNHKQSNYWPVYYKLFSLNAVIFLLLLVWVIGMAAVLNGEPVESNGYTWRAVIDVSELAPFINYIWQLAIVALIVGGLYCINRYLLIRQLLAKHGVLVFLSGVLIAILMFSPIFAKILLLLPLNSGELMLFPSAQRDAFAPSNYPVIFVIFVVTAPIILVVERQAQDKAVVQIAQEKALTELKLLQQQINPHFLFNTLNNLYAMTLTKSELAPDLIMKLSNLLRYTVYEGQKEKVTLEQEIQYLQGYIALQKIRCQNRCEFDFIWPENAGDYSISPLLLIMLLENAFKYGVETTSKSTYVKLHLSITDNKLSLLCENPIFPVEKSQTSGLGLANLYRRLVLLYAGKYTLISEARGPIWHANLTLELEPC